MTGRIKFDLSWRRGACLASNRCCTAVILSLVWAGCAQPVPAPEPGWHSLFNGIDLGSWAPTNFGGEGEVVVGDSQITLRWGNDLTGITWTGDFPTQDYEVVLEAMRIQGNDFFCGLTFPVGESHCSLILGGWGGSVVGLSSIDGFDASENETTQTRRFETQRWYRVRLQVTSEAVRAWIDEEELFDVPIADRRFDVRPEVRLSRPFGIATWRTTAAFRRIRWRPLEELENSP